MCINDQVTKLKSAVRINAACLDLCKNGANSGACSTSTKSACLTSTKVQILTGRAAAEEEIHMGQDAASARRRQQQDAKKAARKTCGCPFRDADRTLDLRDAVLAKVRAAGACFTDTIALALLVQKYEYLLEELAWVRDVEDVEQWRRKMRIY
jgi:hypothetical protein